MIVSGRNFAGLLLCAALGLTTACAGQATMKKTAQHSRVSPTPELIPETAPGIFDRAAEQAELAAALAARTSGDAARAKTLAESAIGRWPGDPAAWQELAADCTALKDTQCGLYAGFFGDKVAFVNRMPPRVAVLGFQNVAEQPAGTSTGSYKHDQLTIDTARRLQAFYNFRDPLAGKRWLPPANPDQAAPDQSDSRTSETE